MFETFDHTADLGLRIRAADLSTLFAEAAEALVSVIVENPEELQCARKRDLSLQAPNLEYLLFDWLNEWLYRFEQEHWLGRRFTAAVSSAAGLWSLTGAAAGQTVDPRRHRLDHEVKAITYHGLKVQQEPDGAWLAEIIVDI